HVGPRFIRGSRGLLLLSPDARCGVVELGAFYTEYLGAASHFIELAIGALTIEIKEARPVLHVSEPAVRLLDRCSRLGNVAAHALLVVLTPHQLVARRREISLASSALRGRLLAVAGD